MTHSVILGLKPCGSIVRVSIERTFYLKPLMSICSPEFLVCDFRVLDPGLKNQLLNSAFSLDSDSFMSQGA